MEHFCLGCDQILVVILRVGLKTWTSFFWIIFYTTMEFQSQPMQRCFAFQMAKNPSAPPSQDFQLMPTPFWLFNSCPPALMPFAHPTLARYPQHFWIHLQDLSPLGIPNSHPRPSNHYDSWFPSKTFNLPRLSTPPKTLNLPRLSTPPKTFTILQHYLINDHHLKHNFLYFFNYKSRCIDSV
jgi:hypothetical protein